VVFAVFEVFTATNILVVVFFTQCSSWKWWQQVLPKAMGYHITTWSQNPKGRD